MSNLGRQVSMRQKTKSALERLDVIEENLPRIVGGFNEVLNRFGTQLQVIDELMTAVVALLGEENVNSKVQENRIKRAEDNARLQAEDIEKRLTDGTLVRVEAISEKSLIVGREFDKEGTVMIPGRVQMDFVTVLPDYKEKLIGQKVGFSVPTPPGGKYEVVEIFEAVEKPAPAEGEVPAAPVGTAVAADAQLETPAEVAALEAQLSPSADPIL
jgi:hypothetical protein